jgi:hypothetical protein
VDKEQARFILRSFRHDGADCSDPEFTEALKLAHADRELGQWLANERSFDAAFAAALAEVKLPVALCKNILAGLAIERGEIPQASDALDTSMIGALASIKPPQALRGKILAAMQSTAPKIRPHGVFGWRAAIPLAAAAGIALAFFSTRGQQAESASASNAPLPVEFVETGFIQTLESPHFSLEEKRTDHRALITHLKERKLPCPCCLPRGLNNTKGIGCRELVINGKSGSLICFDTPGNDIVHLIIFRREDVAGELPQRQAPELSQHGRWAIARWADSEKVFILLGDNTGLTKLAALF